MASALAALHFLRPAFLWGLVPFGLYALALLSRGRERSPWASVVDARLLRHLMSRGALGGLFTPDVLLVPLGALSVLAAAGPTWAPQLGGGDPAHSPLVLVVELSRSMGGADVSPSRAERARLDLLELVHARPSSPTALLVVAGSAHVLMPMTDDPAVLEPYLDALSPDLMPFDGEAFTRVPALIEPLIDPEQGRLDVLLVSDGIPPDGASALADLHHRRGVGFVVLAVGAEGDPARGVPALDRAGLAAFADSADAELIQLSLAERDVGRVLRAIARNRAEALAPDDTEFWEDGGYILAIVLLLGLGLWFRRGWELWRITLASALFLLGCSGRAVDIWLTPDQQGQLLFDRGRYAEAAERFADPMRRGLALYAKSNFTEAAAAFAALDTRDGLFNLGNAYAQGGKLGSAVFAYERALAKSPTFRPARHNLDLVREILRAQQEDTDQEDLAHEEQEHGDMAAQLGADQLDTRIPPVGSNERGAESDGAALSAAEEAAWLRHVETDPGEFIKRKLAVLAAREAP